MIPIFIFGLTQCRLRETKPCFILGEPIEEATEDVSCHVRTRPTRDHEKVKKFIKDKRRKASEERKAQQEDSRRKKIQVQERLLALDAFRKTQVKLKSEMVSEASGRQKLVKNGRFLPGFDNLKLVVKQCHQTGHF